MIKGKKKTIEINHEFRKALNIMEKTRKNVFITGRAGTGKSTLLEYFREHTKKKIVVLAPTGVAALNVRGQTVHSFFGFKPDITVSKVKKLDKKWRRGEIYTELEAIVIDEISMVRADLLDCVDKFMRLNGKDKKSPFGGAQMIFIGDLYQLPPVVAGAEKRAFAEHYASPYFFSAKIFTDQKLLSSGFEMEFIELEKIYRQKDEGFIRLLNAVRNNSATQEDLDALNSRFNPRHEMRAEDFTVYLTSTNAMAAEVNEVRLNNLRGREYIFEGETRGDFDAKSLPTETILRLKKGAQIMMLNNDSAGRWVNGTVGKIADFGEDEEDDFIMVELESGEEARVGRNRWDLYHYRYDHNSKSIESESAGSFTQFPLRLAWAITIHKSQGKTFDQVVIDVGAGTFAHGQMYVALSRCTTLEGMTLKRRLEKRHIWMDWKVVRFVTQFQYQKSVEACSTEDKLRIIEQAIENRRPLRVVYLKSNDVKSKRVITPIEVGENEYMGKTFLGLKGFCHSRQEERMLRVDRILEIEVEDGLNFDNQPKK